MRRDLRSWTVSAVVASTLLVAVGCGTRSGGPGKEGIEVGNEITGASRAIADRFQAYLVEHDPSMVFRGAADLKLARIPDISEEATRSLADHARSVIAEIDALDPSTLSHGDEMLLDIVRFRCDQLVLADEFYWNEFVAEPWFNTLPVIANFMTKFPLTDEGYVSTYLDLVGGLPGLVRQQREKTAGQAERGIVLPRGVVEYAVRSYRAQIVDPERHPLVLTQERLSAVGGDHADAIEHSREAVARLNDELSKMAEFLDGDYKSAAPSSISYDQYPNGGAYYRAMLRQNTTLDVTPEEVFEIGQRERDAIEARMAEIRQSLGFEGGREAFTTAAMADPARVMKTPEEFGRRLNAAIDRIRPVMGSFFSRMPAADCSAERIAPELEPLYHNGVYNRPMPPDQPLGHYYFNGLDMQRKNPLKTAGLAYHEMIPGHHYQIALTMENDTLHPLVKASAVTAFTEGWAEYASALAGEMGMYDDPALEYGRLENDLYLTNFLILDPGMNAMGWSTDRMAAYLRPYLPDFSEERLSSQIMRVAISVPGFTPAYKLGSMKIAELRRRAEEELGDDFDIKEFHDAVLQWGSIPLSILAKHVDWYIEQVKKGRG